jgi:hypothetical protein
MAFMARSLMAFVGLVLASLAAHAQVEEVVTAKLERHSIAGLAMRLQSAKAVKHGIALFPGHPGILKLQQENGEPRFEMRGNFLVRSRRHWLDDETLVVVLDAPSDQWNDFSQHFRATARYGADVARVLTEVSTRFPVESWTFVGTSEGSVSAFHAARMNPQLARRVILTASLFEPGRNGPGLAGARFDELAAPLLWVHHEADPCRFTPYYQARRHAERTMSPLLSVSGGGPEKGDPCQAFSFHGFVGRERAVVLAMHAWVKTGVLPANP